MRTHMALPLAPCHAFRRCLLPGPARACSTARCAADAVLAGEQVHEDGVGSVQVRGRWALAGALRWGVALLLQSCPELPWQLECCGPIFTSGLGDILA